MLTLLAAITCCYAASRRCRCRHAFDVITRYYAASARALPAAMPCHDTVTTRYNSRTPLRQPYGEGHECHIAAWLLRYDMPYDADAAHARLILLLPLPLSMPPRYAAFRRR